MRFRSSLSAMVLLAAMGGALAQSTNPATTPDLGLSPDQRVTIFTSVSGMNKKATAAPGFQPIVGAIVPGTMELQAMPDTIVTLMPATKGYEVAMVENQVIVVEPASKRVVEVIIAR